MAGGKREGAGRKKGSKNNKIRKSSAFGLLVSSCPEDVQQEIIKGRSKSMLFRKHPNQLKIDEYVDVMIRTNVFDNPFVSDDVRNEFLVPIRPLINLIKGNQMPMPETKITPEEEPTQKKSLSPTSKEILEKYPNLLSGRDNK